MFDPSFIDTDAGFSRTGQALSPAEWAAAEQVAARLHVALRSLIHMLPEESRGGSALARNLGVDRATCQRVSGVALGPRTGVDILARVPGVQGLRQVIAAFENRVGHDPAVVAEAAAAVEHFAATLEKLGGSQRRLAQRLNSGGGGGESGGDRSRRIGSREALFRAAAELCGRRNDTQAVVYAFCPSPQDPQRMNRAVVTAHIGHQSTEPAIPLVLTTGRTVEPGGGPLFANLNQTAQGGDAPMALVEAFCSRPLPRVTARSSAIGSAARVTYAIDPAPGATPGEAMDLVVGSRTMQTLPNPATEQLPIEEVWTLLTFPARALVFDVYMHRALARQAFPGLEAHLFGPDMAASVGDRWATRLPGGPKLIQLGLGAASDGSAASDAYARHAELTAHLFDRAGWDAAEFVGYRCELAYPVWRAGYCMTFDFSDAAPRP